MKKPLKFEFIYEDLKERILMDEFKEAGKLPPEYILTETYKCSRPTLQKALRMLINEKIVSTIQGSGTFINPQPAEIETTREFSTKTNGQSLYGLIFPNLGPGFIFKTITDSIAESISHLNASLIWGGYISPSASNLQQQIKDICDSYIELGIKGVFFAPFEYNEYSDEANTFIVNSFTNANIPIVLVDADITQYPQRSSYDLVSLDHVHAGYTITSHMIEKGAKKILFLTLPYSKNSYKLRLMGFHEALFDHGIPPTEAYMVTCKPEHTEEVAEVLKKYKPDGIITLIDRAAVSLITTLRKLGISVPHDILIGSFDDLGYLFDMSISTIRQPLEQIGKAAVKMMIEREKDLSLSSRTVTYSGELKEGVSSNPDSPISL
ncbi:MAG: substrate-binding domain-containing protein [Sphaerochaetaceae bacterium]|nr:substrate-binding domain-containing protein [Sphaerochaetaceae bacterium]